MAYVTVGRGLAPAEEVMVFLCVGNDRFLAGLGMTEVVGMVGKVARNDGEGAAVIGVGLVGYNIVR